MPPATSLISQHQECHVTHLVRRRLHCLHFLRLLIEPSTSPLPASFNFNYNQTSTLRVSPYLISRRLRLRFHLPRLQHDDGAQHLAALRQHHPPCHKLNFNFDLIKFNFNL